MISTTINYACDVEGCDSKSETKDVDGGMVLSGLPRGWADLHWLAERKPEFFDPRQRFMRALKKVRHSMPPEMAEFQEAGAALMTGEVGPQAVSCRAIICDKCLDKINLGDFDVEHASMGVLEPVD